MADEDGVVRAWTGLHFAYREMSKLLDERLRAESECSLSDVDVLNELYCTPEHRLQMLVLAERLRVPLLAGGIRYHIGATIAVLGSLDRGIEETRRAIETLAACGNSIVISIAGEPHWLWRAVDPAIRRLDAGLEALGVVAPAVAEE